MDCRAMEHTSQKAYQRREMLLDGRETRFYVNEQRKNLLKVAVASSAKKQLKK